MLDAIEITTMHDEATTRWHSPDPWPDALTFDSLLHSEPAHFADHFLEIALANHRANFDLWHEEDKAREPEATNSQIADVKHAIDRLNQRRNDLLEAMDRVLLSAAGDQNEASPLHSETPGLMIDRLSILALKLYHTAEESRRASASEEHRQRNLRRLALLREQRSDLASCLDELWKEIQAGKRRFKLYRQMKMYNDPELNPAVYSHKVTHKAG
jgi:hypothetical protein